jgi:hypothetical protein
MIYDDDYTAKLKNDLPVIKQALIDSGNGSI